MSKLRSVALPVSRPALSSCRFIHPQVEDSNSPFPSTEVINGVEYKRYTIDLNPGVYPEDVLQDIRFPPSSVVKIVGQWDCHEGSDHFSGFIGAFDEEAVNVLRSSPYIESIKEESEV